MDSSKEDIIEFQKLYEKDTGENVSFEEAREMWERLVRLYLLLAKPLPPPEDLEDSEKPSSSDKS